jgi:hypothetical protein
MTELFSELPVDARGRAFGQAARRVVLTGFAVFSLLALWGLFGQRESESVATGAVDEIRAEARQQSIGSLADVRFAVLETNGRLSFVKT